MAVITNASHTWSAGVVLTADEFWQVQKGEILLATGASAPAAGTADGILLTDLDGDGYPFKSGTTVYYRLNTSYKATRGSVLVRMVG